MPLSWILSNLILLVILLVMACLYSFSYFKNNISNTYMTNNNLLNWWW